MIEGKTKTQLEADYRAIDKDSSSSLKDFSQDRKKYFKKYIKGDKVEEKENHAANMGRIVETLLLEKEEFENRFYMSTVSSTPTGLMLEFVEALYRFSKEATDEFGTVTRDFEQIAKDAYVASGFKIKFEAVLGKFLDSEAEIYYNEIRTVRTKNLTVITTQDVTNAEKIVESLKSNFVTADTINLVNSSRYSVLNQLKIENYEIDGLPLKSMLDKVIVDHDKKSILPIDLKCTWSVENFYEEYYLYRRAYIQAYLYYNAVLSLTTKEDSEYYGYTVENLQFLVCDSTDYMNPLIYTLSDKDMIDAYLGFEHKGKTYPGVHQIIDDLKWALSTNTWNISKNNFLANGLINIKG
jgi:hypothetical protein